MAEPLVVCLCGSLPGYRAAEFLTGRCSGARFTVNQEERNGHWTLTPFDLGLELVREDDIPALNPDLVLTVFYNRILAPEIFKPPGLGAWNLHLGDCERYRGAYPSIRAIMNGDREYSVTLHRIDGGIDTGEILDKLSFPIPPHITGRELYMMMTEKGMELLQRRWDDLASGRALGMTRPQDGSRAETMRRKSLSLELHPSRDLVDRVRALTFPPFPPPYFVCGGKKYRITAEEDTD